MKPSRLSQCWLMLVYATAAFTKMQAQVLPGGPAQPPNFNDSVMTAGLSTVGSDGANWAYLVWRSPSPKTLQGKSVAVFLQTTPGGPFTQEAIVRPTTAIPAIQLLINRAATLGADNAACDKDLRDLLRRKNWAGNVANTIATGTSPFDNKPLAEKIAAAIDRALISEEAMASLQSVAHVHPALRMALGRAWAAPLPAGAGPMVVEARDWTHGTDGGVIGRVVLTPGQGVTLTAPGRIVQVPHLKPKSDRTILLRWAVPDDLRRQQLHVLGFHVYRMDRDYAETHGLPLNATPAQIETFVTNHGALVMDRVTTTPVPIKKLYDDTSVDQFQFPFDPAEPDEHFVADDANRDQPFTEGNLNDRYGGFADGTRCRYFVRAVDLLGRTGPPSPVGDGISVLTIPPDVPQGLTVADLPVGAGAQRHQVLRWKANGTPQGVAGRTAQRYAIYRGNMPTEGPTNLYSLETPFMFRNLTPLAVIEHSAAEGGWLSYTDTTALPLEGNINRGVWYAVTAVHDTPLDSFFDNIHHRVESAPSAPAFGVFRDREGPAAPVGFIDVNCGKLMTLWTGAGQEARTAPPSAESKAVHVRARCTRTGSDIRAVRFRFYSDGRLAAVMIHESPILPFGGATGDAVTYETTFFDSQTTSLVVQCVGLSADDCASVPALSQDAAVPASESLWHVESFEMGRYSPTDFVPGGAMEDEAETLSFSSQNGQGPDTVRGLLSSHTYDGRTAVVQQLISIPGFGSSWLRRGVAQVRGNEVYFIHQGRSLNDTQNPNYRVILLPEGGDCECVHDARPEDADEIIPVVVSSTVPESTREWRLYRRVDEGDLSLVKSLVVDPSPLKPEQVLAEDSNLPPHGAKVRYYLQCFDQNNNPSPLVYIGEVVLVPTPAVPQMNPPEALAAVNGMGRLNLKWFCPPPGVEKFRIYVAPLKLGDPEASVISPGFTTTVAASSNPPPSGVVIPTSYQLPGEPAAKTIQALRFFDSANIPAGSFNPLHQAEFEVTPGVDYVIWVNVFGLRQTKYLSSTARIFRWQAPQATGPETLVAWPSRPLPEVVTLPGVAAFLTAPMLAAPTYLPNQSTIHNADAAALYPVAVSIGVMGVLPFSIEHSPSDPMCATHPFYFAVKTPNLGGQPSVTVPTSLGNDPQAYLVKDILPAVLFRQTILQDESPGALVQVTPLRAAIAHRRDPLPAISYGSAEFTTLKDPFIKAMTFSSGPLSYTLLNLIDTHPVEEGATYQYYLVNYRADGEISRVIDCGTVSIPESP